MRCVEATERALNDPRATVVGERSPKRILYFFPFQPLPADSGAQKRCTQILAGLARLGHRTRLLYCDRGFEHDAQASALRARWGTDAHVYRPRFFDYRLTQVLNRARARARIAPYGSPLMRAWVGAHLAAWRPDVVLMSYAFTDPLFPRLPGWARRTVIDAIDLSSLYEGRLAALAARLSDSVTTSRAAPDDVLEEDFFARLPIRTDPEEYGTYDRYAHTMAIAEREATQIREHTSRTTVTHVPMTLAPVAMPMDPSGSALFTMRKSPFNLQGYFYFVKKVLPRILRRAETFRLRVIGTGCAAVEPEPGVDLGGFVPEVAREYRAARLVVNPVFGGTGQQVKIVEAMAHGRPVVALRDAAAESPLHHEVNGLVAKDAEEFAECVLRLWTDYALCRRLGDAARGTIARDFSHRRLEGSLAAVFG